MHAVRKYASFVACFVEATILGSALFGWTSLVFILQEEGMFSYLCQHSDSTSTPTTSTQFNISTSTSYNTSTSTPTNQTLVLLPSVGCPEQKVALSTPYTVGIIVFGVGALPVGWFFDRFGLRSTRTITALIGSVGYLQIAFTSPGSEWLLMLGMACVGLSCYVIIMTTSYVALLAESKAAIMNAINNAGIGTAFAYPTIKIAYDHGVPHRYSFIFMSCLWMLVLFSSWLILPSYKIEDGKEEKEIAEQKDTIEANKPSAISLERQDPYQSRCPSGLTQSLKSYNTTTSKEDTEIRKATDLSAKGEIGFREFVLSPTFVLFVYWFCALHVRFGLMISGYDAWMTQVVRGDIIKVSYYTDVMAYAVLAGVITTPLPGILTDYVRARLRSEVDGTATAMIPALTLTSVLMSALSVCKFFDSETAIFAAVIILAIAKPCLYSTTATFVGLLAPRDHFGIIFGILNIISGVASFMIYPYLIWVSNTGSFVPLESLVLGTALASLVLPVKLYIDRQRNKQSKIQQKLSPGVLYNTHL